MHSETPNTPSASRRLVNFAHLIGFLVAKHRLLEIWVLILTCHNIEPESVSYESVKKKDLNAATDTTGASEEYRGRYLDVLGYDLTSDYPLDTQQCINSAIPAVKRPKISIHPRGTSRCPGHKGVQHRVQQRR